MNLVDDPWVPCIAENGNVEHLSLHQLFHSPANFLDLSANTQERIALTRLLIAITQSAIGFPEDETCWDTFGADLESKTCDYLQKWKDSFALLGDGPRFLQSKLPTVERNYEIDQIIFTTASGVTPTVLDHRNELIREMESALLLLVYQNFFIGGCMGPLIRGNGPALKYLHTFVRGRTLRDYITRNCIDQASLDEVQGIPQGRPIWELPEDQGNGTKTYLGRLVPMPCKLWIGDDATTVQIGQGWKYPEFGQVPPETSASVAVFSQQDLRLLRANLDKGIWRDLHAICVGKGASQDQGRASLIMLSHQFQFERMAEIPVWCGELVKAKDAKILDAVESVFQIPTQMLTTPGHLLYQKGITYSEFRSELLKKAVREYGKTLLVDKPDTTAALRSYWHYLERHSHELLAVVRDPDLLDKERFGPSSDPWSRAVQRAAVKAYNESCPQTSPRQIHAFTRGLNLLFPRKKKQTESAAKT